METLRGGCLCGAVTFTVADAFEYALNCHCSQCRRATGAAFKPFGGIMRNHLTVISGQDDLKTYGDGPDAHDARCGKCGSFLYSVVRDGAYVHVNYGTLHTAPSLAPHAHIYAGSKAPWYDIMDDLPQHIALP